MPPETPIQSQAQSEEAQSDEAQGQVQQALNPTKPLPPHFQFDPAHTKPLYDYLTNILVPQAKDGPIRVAPAIATYTTKSSRDYNINSALDEYREDATLGVTISSAQRHWPASCRVVGLVNSCLNNTAEWSQGQDMWHIVGMARDGAEVWIYDTEYIADEHRNDSKGQPPRLPRGQTNVRALVGTMPKVNGVWIQGPSRDYKPGRQECMGRSIAWIEALALQQIPWPSEDTTGWTWHRLT